MSTSYYIWPRRTPEEIVEISGWDLASGYEGNPCFTDGSNCGFYSLDPDGKVSSIERYGRSHISDLIDVIGGVDEETVMCWDGGDPCPICGSENIIGDEEGVEDPYCGDCKFVIEGYATMRDDSPDVDAIHPILLAEIQKVRPNSSIENLMMDIEDETWHVNVDGNTYTYMMGTDDDVVLFRNNVDLSDFFEFPMPDLPES